MITYKRELIWLKWLSCLFFEVISMIMEGLFSDMFFRLCKGNIRVNGYMLKCPLLALCIILAQPLIEVGFQRTSRPDGSQTEIILIRETMVDMSRDETHVSIVQKMRTDGFIFVEKLTFDTWKLYVSSIVMMDDSEMLMFLNLIFYIWVEKITFCFVGVGTFTKYTQTYISVRVVLVLWCISWSRKHIRHKQKFLTLDRVKFGCRDNMEIGVGLLVEYFFCFWIHKMLTESIMISSKNIDVFVLIGKF